MTSMVTDAQTQRLSDLDALVWAIEHDPRLRTTIVVVAVVDGELDRRRLHRRVERLSRRVPRLRKRIATRGGEPRWEPVDDFRATRHLRVTDFGGAGTADDVRSLAAELGRRSFSPDHPRWELTLVEGLRDGGTALIVASHHTISDGMGGVEIALELFDLAAEPDPDRHHLPALGSDRAGGDPTPPARRARLPLPRDLARLTLAGAGRALDADLDLTDTARRSGALLGSLHRQLRGVGGQRPGRLRRRSDELAFDALAVPLEALRASGRRAGGTVNDAFVAGVSLGLVLHRRRGGGDLAALRIAVPVSDRTEVAGLTEDDLGNHWTPAVLDLRLDGVADEPADSLVAAVRHGMRRLRNEPTHDVLGGVTGVLRHLPPTVTSALVGGAADVVDVTVSNVPGTPVGLHLAGRPVRQLVPFGPITGGALNVTLLSHAGTAHLGIARDPVALPDGQELVADLAEAFERIVR